MFRLQNSYRFAPVAVALAALALALAGGARAEVKEGGQNTLTHKLLPPSRVTVKCRICAGTRCTVVSVHGRCTKQRALAALDTRIRQRSRRQPKARPEPQIDDRSYRQLEEGTRRRIPRHTPEWTNQNESDPGVAILDAARRNPQSVRVQPVPDKFRPEVDDEVVLGFEQDDQQDDPK